MRRLSRETGLSVGSCHYALRKSLKLYPYRMSSLHELIPTDCQKRVDYCQWFQQHMDDNALDMTFFSDEAWIHLSGYINSQNTRIWSAHNPHEFVESPLHPLKIGIWMAMSRRRIVGLIFFQGRLNSVSYCEIINQFVAQLTENENRNA